MSKISSDEIKERESFAKDHMCQDLKKHYQRTGTEVSGEKIEREVKKMQEDCYRKRDHEIYKE